MIRFSINSENKTIELLSGGTIEELRDLCEKYKDYSFSVSFARAESLNEVPKTENKGMVVGANYIKLIGNIEHN